MANSAYYKIQFLLGDTDNQPLNGVAYVVISNGKVLAKGNTSAKGETSEFEVQSMVTVQVQLYNSKLKNGKGGYITPSLYVHDAAAIILNNPVVNQVKALQNKPILMSDVLKKNAIKSAPPSPLMVKAKTETVSLRLKSYVVVELRDFLKREFKTRLNYDVLDESGKIIKKDKKELKEFRTEKAGRTQLHYIDQPVKLRFYGGDLGKVKVSTDIIQPFYAHQDVVKIQYVKTAPATTAPKIDHTTLLAGKKNIPVIVDPKTNEIYVLSPDDFKDFLEVSGELQQAIKKLHQGREKVSAVMALEAKTPEQIREAEKNLGLAQEEAIEAMNKHFKQAADIREVIAFEMFSTQDGQKKLNAVRKYTKASQHVQNKNNRLNKSEYKLTYQLPWKNEADEVSIESKKGAPNQIDKEKFKEDFTKTIKTISTEVVAAQGSKSLTLVPDPDLFGITATELVESYQSSDSSEVNFQAQWLRLVAGTGYDGTLKWGNKGIHATGSAYAQAKLVLLEGKKKWLWAYPSLKGWIMESDGVPMGAIRFICGAEVAGFSGAVLAASSAFAVTTGNDGKMQMLDSISREPGASLAKYVNTAGRSVLAMKKGQMDDTVSPDNHFNAGIKAFAGAEASISPFGGLQWLDPEQPKDFTDLAKIAPTLGLSGGVGGSADFQLYYDDGAFRFKASLAACYGVGGRGALEFVVDFKNIYGLIKFVAYQLTYVSFKKLVYMTHRTFILLHKISMLLPFGDDKALPNSIALINAKFDAFKSKMKIAEQRIKICRKINAREQWLKYLSPESRGCFLYHITRHGFWSKVNDPAEKEGFWILGNDKEYQLPEHKQAVLNLFRSVTVVSHWSNTLQHMSADGERSSKSVAANESELLDFLNLGSRMGVLPLADLADIKRRIAQDHHFPKDFNSGNKYIDEYLKMRGERILSYPKDYKLTDFDSTEFRKIQVAQHLDKPEIFLAQAPQPIEDLDVEQYLPSQQDKTWLA